MEGTDNGITLNFENMDATEFLADRKQGHAVPEEKEKERKEAEAKAETTSESTAPEKAGNENSNPELESQIKEILSKEENDLTDEEKQVLLDNEAIAEKLSKGDEGSEESGVVADLKALEGFVEEGEYEDSLEGIKQYQKDRDGKRDPLIIGSFLKANPKMAAFYKHVVVDGKSEDSFLKEVSKPELLKSEVKSIKSSTSEIEKESIIDQHVKIIKQDLIGKLPEKTIEAILKVAVENGDTEQMAKDSLVNLNASYSKEVEALEAQKVAERQQEEREIEERIKTIKGLVSKGIIANNIAIPEVDKQGFIEFLTVPIDSVTGETKQEKVLNSLSNEEDMVLDYLLYIKSKTGKLDTSALKSNTSVSKFFKNSKKANDNRTPKTSKGSKIAYGDVRSLPNGY